MKNYTNFETFNAGTQIGKPWKDRSELENFKSRSPSPAFPSKFATKYGNVAVSGVSPPADPHGTTAQADPGLLAIAAKITGNSNALGQQAIAGGPTFPPVVDPVDPEFTDEVADSAPDNIIPIDSSVTTDAPSDPVDDWQAAHEGRAAEVAAQMEQIRAIGERVGAAINGDPAPPPAAAVAPGASPAERTVAPRKAPFTGFPKGPITFDSKHGEPWASGDEVGFNSAAVENANPSWRGGVSWTPKNVMGGGFPTMGTPDKPHVYSPQAESFYQRAALRGDSRRVQGYNARIAKQYGGT